MFISEIFCFPAREELIIVLFAFESDTQSRVSYPCAWCYFLDLYTLETILEKLRGHIAELKREHPIFHPGVFVAYATSGAIHYSNRLTYFR